MNAQRRKFCDEYLKCGNATESAKKAGYSEKTAKSCGQRLLTFADVAEYIQDHSDKIHDDDIASSKEVRKFLTSTMRNPAEKTKERLKAAEMLAKIQGQFIEKVDVSGDIGVMIIDDITK